MKTQWYTKRWLTVTVHVLVWSFLFLFPLLLQSSVKAPKKEGDHLINTNNFFYLQLVNNFFRLALFYANAYFFLPKFLFRRRYIAFILCMLVSYLILLGVDRISFELFIGREYNIVNALIFTAFPFFFFVLISSSFRLIRDRMRDESQRQEKETENLKTELSLLHSQVSPHFLFNVLNNMVAMARKKSDQLEPSLMKLSSLLRYMLYETHHRVPLQKEVEYLQSYIDLQQLRYGKKLTMNVSMDSIDASYDIEPMLLIPFVENAFKHGTGAFEDPVIDVKLSAENNRMHFYVRNKYNPTSTEIKDSASGIGLQNVQRRLQLIYGDNSKLSIDKENGWFIVSLQLNLL